MLLTKGVQLSGRQACTALGVVAQSQPKPLQSALKALRPLNHLPLQCSISKAVPGGIVISAAASAGTGSNGNTGQADSSAGPGPSTGGSSTNGNSSAAAAPSPSYNGGNGGVAGGGSSGPPAGKRVSGGDDGGDQQPPGFSLPLSRQQLSYAVLALSAASVLLLLFVWQHSLLLGSLDAAVCVLAPSLEGMADGPSTRDSVAALKRLLREVFAEQLAIKQRLTEAERAAAAAGKLEAADDYQLHQAVSSSSTWSRAPVRMSGHLTAAGVLPWSQEADRAEALSMLSGLGVSGAADAVLQLHSVLAGGKRRVTAEFCQAAQDGAAAALRLQAVLLRVQVRSWLKLMIAPLGGGLAAVGRSLTPVRGDFGCTQALRQGHGLTVLQHRGSGKAVSLVGRHLSAAAGLFVGGSSRTGIAQLQARSEAGHTLSLVAAHIRAAAPCTQCSQEPDRSTGHAAAAAHKGLRFLGVQSPSNSATTIARHQLTSGHVVGAVGVMPVTDALTATAWVEKPLAGRAGAGVGVFCQPDDDGLEMGLAVGRPAGQDQGSRLLYCELSAKVPAGQGLSVSPCAVYTRRPGASSLAYVMQSCWRW